MVVRVPGVSDLAKRKELKRKQHRMAERRKAAQGKREARAAEKALKAEGALSATTNKLSARLDSVAKLEVKLSSKSMSRGAKSLTKRAGRRKTRALRASANVSRGVQRMGSGSDSVGARVGGGGVPLSLPRTCSPGYSAAETNDRVRAGGVHAYE